MTIKQSDPQTTPKMTASEGVDFLNVWGEAKLAVAGGRKPKYCQAKYVGKPECAVSCGEYHCDHA